MKYLLTIILFVSANIFSEETDFGAYLTYNIGSGNLVGCSFNSLMSKNRELDLYKCANFFLTKTDAEGNYEWEVFQVEHAVNTSINTIWMRKINR